MNDFRKRLKNLSLTATFTIRHFFIMLGTAVLCFFAMFFFNRLGIVIYYSPILAQILLFILISIVLSSLCSIIFMRKPLKTFEEILSALSRISEGDYGVRLNERVPRVAKKFNTTFNHMAEELGSVEMLRNDFVNNFSHEFKTPIVSIGGFARMLKRDDITPEEKNEYLDIIISESDRLAELSTKVLNLSKIENQHILTDKRGVNVSEQIRLAVTLLEKKWSKRKIDILFDAEEVYMLGNEELLKQVWLNLIDNAVKFSPEYGAVKIDVRQSSGSILVSVANEGEISLEEMAHIFDKFYQGDTSRASQGNGLGLAIAKKITELHGGALKVESAPGGRVIFRAEFL